MNETQNTLDQRRADYAWEKVKEVEPSDIKEYTVVAKSIPSMIMNSGLMQTLAFMKTKGDKSVHEILLGNILKWLDYTQNEKPLKPPGNPQFGLMMDGLIKCEKQNYMQATNETMELLRWIRQFAAARKAMEG